MKANTKYKKISNNRSIYWQCNGLVQQYPQYAPTSIYRHANKIIDSVVHDHRKSNPGRSKKLSKQNEQMLLRTLLKLRKEIKSFTARHIKYEVCINNVSDRTARRLLSKSNFRYLHSRKNRLLGKKVTANAQFARKVIEFYLEGKKKSGWV